MIPEAYGCHESPILPPYASVSKERRYAVEGTAPHRIALRVRNVGNFSGNFGEVAGGKPPKAINSPATRMVMVNCDSH